MSHILSIELSEDAYRAIQRQAELTGSSAADLAAASLEQHFRQESPARSEAEKEAARTRFERHFGEVDLGSPTGADNESIDADLAKEYAGRGEEQ